MNVKRALAGLGVAGCLLILCGCVKAVTGQYYQFRADQLYADNQKRDAFELYYEAANAGMADAQYVVAQMLLFGDGVHANVSKGLQWLEAAARQEHAPAARDLGVYLIGGEFGLSPDPRRAVWLLERAAAGGDASAMLILGHLHWAGCGVTRDTRAAAEWYGRAAHAGEPVPPEWQDAGYLARSAAPAPVDARAESRARVRRAQSGLKALGYYRSGIDGIAGPGTLAAVKQFQRDNQLEPDGRIDVVLMRHLYRRIVFDPMKRHI